MMIALAHFGADSSSGIGVLGVDAGAFVVQLITFVLVLLVLRKYAVGPILKMLEARRATIESGVSLGERMKQESVELEAKVAKELREARKQADAILADAQDAARDAGRETEAKAQKKAEQILAEAKAATQRNVAQARKKLEKELIGLVADATEVIIDEKVDSAKDSVLISKALHEREKQAA